MDMNLKMYYRSYRPAGFTDDLGIIADQNQWVAEQPAGWYIFANVDIINPMLQWMKEVGIDYKFANNWLIVPRDDDAVIVQLRWA